MQNFNDRPATAFIKSLENEDWDGFGYLQGRRVALAEGRVEDVAAADDFLYSAMTRSDLRVWANSKAGRWFADDAFFGRGLEAAKKSFL